MNNLTNYTLYVPVLDDIPQKNELNLGKIGKGTGLDGIPTQVLRLMPNCILGNN